MAASKRYGLDVIIIKQSMAAVLKHILAKY